MADIDLKTATPDTTIADDAILFGADSQLESVPSVYPVSVIRAHIVGDGTVDVAADKVFSVSNTLTLDGTDSTTMTFPSTSATIARTDDGQTFIGDQSIDGSLTVDGSVSVYGVTAAYTEETATYSVVEDDYFIDCTSNTFTVTLPTAVGFAGKIYVIKNSGTGAITIDTTSAQTIDGADNVLLNVQYQSLTVISDGANWKVV